MSCTAFDADVAASLLAEDAVEIGADGRGAEDAAAARVHGFHDVVVVEESVAGAPLPRVRLPAMAAVADPMSVDIHALLHAYDGMYFSGTLGGVDVSWSKRMTLCAGICVYRRAPAHLVRPGDRPGAAPGTRGARGYGQCSIRLSEPLLQLRPVSDLVDTLLHECIHAYLFLTGGDVDRDGHGPDFLRWSRHLNDIAGTHITVYHSFHDEVAASRRHVWRCTGPCRATPPWFGYVRRAMNRPPGPRDWWWPRHAAQCSGAYEKIAEPERVAKPKRVAARRHQGTNDGKTEGKADVTGPLDGYLVPQRAGSPSASVSGGEEEVLDFTHLTDDAPPTCEPSSGRVPAMDADCVLVEPLEDDADLDALVRAWAAARTHAGAKRHADAPASAVIEPGSEEEVLDLTGC